MKVAFIIVLYKTSKKEQNRLKSEVHSLKLGEYKTYFIDNSVDNRGYAAGVNRGIRDSLKDDPDLFVIMNPDVSLSGLSKKSFIETSGYFDLWGFAMRQGREIFYYGELDRKRLTGALSSKRPASPLVTCDFPPGPIICMKKAVFQKIGFWDEDYFLYYEDVDYSFKAKKAGFTVGVNTNSYYDHFDYSEKNNPKKKYYLSRSRWKFFFKYATIKQKLYELIRLPKTLTEERPFVLNFLILNTSSFLNKLLNFVLFIFLIRFLSVKDYGIYTLVWAHVALLQPFLDFGTTSYGLVYLPEKENLKMNSLFSLRVLLAVGVFIGTLFLAFFLRFDNVVLTYIFLTSFTLFSNMLSGSLLIFSSIREKLLLPSLLSIGFNTLLIAALILGILTMKSLSSIFFLIFIFYNSYSIVNFIILKREIPNLKFTIQVNDWIKILKKSTTFLLIGLFAGLYFKLDVFLLNFLKGPRDVGIYSSGYKFLEAFLFIAASYNIVSTPFMAKLRKEAILNLKTKIRKDILYLFVLGLTGSFLIFSLSPYLLTFIFRKDYSEAIPVLKIVIWSLPFILLTSVFFNGLYVLGKAKVVMWLFIAQTFFNVILNLMFIPQYSYIASSYITISGEILNSVIAFIFLRRTLKHENIS
ncbi:hypothetical protein A3G67_04255 [Candidatus Roizmanbacteria bacterium RIFCSPLOWO2_12_FULL_40_12]|uniref:Uncharacterized protein n=1 Tax=Candidatus Roizmanbacteria bacterium RIFCSPLOWO2_01_FULL_40_42 TaxID=1802066 RepID=A0A1F7J6N4_9BACT|nr:MAG: hypothetical protein A2779_00635 [Candidatus Roizmanbacteria bacterium RIFCSPHIGHO2_01_FULL_40_98]OGK29154.1 MAG: hypothetical protein A3C31_02610 [Candidatus Roizmanbacteria bacterium RIFCSPHIGHO2_02_FULL_40_53]OGK37190.1 MAG: hypothetical protein A3E69_01820 [Candidatus Roizmanbacteria bacterium RIFCSPHIGHO2_12_FULL_40_130]OGK51264.1 MAG: hypothetical protein A3B50_04695 [Candidatus Roizmanbacteria bacterium RIFCSPLOWO2_01_FULL_40_42]OGK58735.1 MAG: hypothetical protein A3H84_02335 [C